MNDRIPITEGWLKGVGFRWHQLDRQPEMHWLLWLGGGIDGAGTSFEDLGIEIASCAYTGQTGARNLEGSWFCWLRSDTAHRYSRFLHIRHIRFQDEVIHLVEALSGLPWKPENHIYGSLHAQPQADRIRAEWQRFDLRMLRDGYKWREIEKDDSRGQALPDHMEEAEKSRGRKR
ncbi:MAG TPA: hypothetical protein VMV27_02140 [Candidatus Binataceae bacterium]|nr:hypothetical protein [Candidatus Binataceae bacterium]